MFSITSPAPPSTMLSIAAHCAQVARAAAKVAADEAARSKFIEALHTDVYHVRMLREFIGPNACTNMFNCGSCERERYPSESPDAICIECIGCGEWICPECCEHATPVDTCLVCDHHNATRVHSILGAGNGVTHAWRIRTKGPACAIAHAETCTDAPVYKEAEGNDDSDESSDDDDDRKKRRRVDTYPTLVCGCTVQCDDDDVHDNVCIHVCRRGAMCPKCMINLLKEDNDFSAAVERVERESVIDAFHAGTLTKFA